jgi:hypothetical protein
VEQAVTENLTNFSTKSSRTSKPAQKERCFSCWGFRLRFRFFAFLFSSSLLCCLLHVTMSIRFLQPKARVQTGSPCYGGGISPEGRVVAVGGGFQDNYSIRLYSTSDLSLIDTFFGHTDEVYDIVFLPNSSRFVSCGAQQPLCFWDRTTHSCFASVAFDTAPTSLACSPDGSVLVLGAYRTCLWFVRVADQQVMPVLWPDTSMYTEMAQFIPGGRPDHVYVLLSGRSPDIVSLHLNSDSNEIKFLNAFPPEPTREPVSAARAVADPAGQYVVVGSAKRLRLYHRVSLPDDAPRFQSIGVCTSVNYDMSPGLAVTKRLLAVMDNCLVVHLLRIPSLVLVATIAVDDDDFGPFQYVYLCESPPMLVISTRNEVMTVDLAGLVRD